MPAWLKTNLKAVFVPGGVMLGTAALLLATSWIPLSTAGVNFFYYAVFVAALALALRFRYLRVVLCALVLLVSHYVLHGAAQGWFGGRAPEKFAFEVIALLVPVNILLLNLVAERTLDRNSLIGMGAVLFFESTFVVVFSRPEQTLSLFHFSLLHTYHLKLPQPALLMFVIALAVSLVRVVRSHRPIEHGIFWSLLAT